MTRSSHILIVDDDRELRQLLTAFLGRHGYRVESAPDGRAMVKLFWKRVGSISSSWT